tara:strand:+ start:430 stop:2097 length:1668 start_codon:yes stop_codon:yes gene_type:complete
MRCFLIFVFTFSLGFSKQLFESDSLDVFDLNIINTFNLEISNIGDPILFLVLPLQNNNFSLSHYSQKVRFVDYDKKDHLIESDSIYSHIFYQSAYNAGGVLKTFLTRPIGKNVKLKFSYDNLSSEGFLQHQQNKYSSLFLSLHYINKKTDYSLFFSFLSNNATYNQNGGVIYDSLVSLDLMQPYLTAQSILKNRELKLNHHYQIHNKLKLRYGIFINFFERYFIDSDPTSFYYSLTPLYYSIVSDYSLTSYFTRVLNTLSLLNENISFTINHNYYNSDNLVVNNIGDLDISISSSELFKKDKNINFNVNFCPIGYNKNNYILDFDVYKNLKKSTHNLKIILNSKKPNFFTEHYNTSYSFNWNEFNSLGTISMFFNSYFNKSKILISSSLNQYSNYLYFNELVSPVQLEEKLLYFNLILNKDWHFKKMFLKSSFCFQQSDNTVLSVPSFLFQQKIEYKSLLLKDISFLSSFTFNIFSKYYINSYFPLTDLFYRQINQKNGLIPLGSLSFAIEKADFSFGLVFRNISSLFLENNFLINNYPIPPQTVQLSIKWQLLN